MSDEHCPTVALIPVCVHQIANLSLACFIAAELAEKRPVVWQKIMREAEIPVENWEAQRQAWDNALQMFRVMADPDL